MFLALLLPETLDSNILLKRARRLRKLTGNPNLRSQSEIDQASSSGRELLYESFVRPFLLASEPAVFFFNLYIGLVCALFNLLSLCPLAHSLIFFVDSVFYLWVSYSIISVEISVFIYAGHAV